MLPRPLLPRQLQPSMEAFPLWQYRGAPLVWRGFLAGGTPPWGCPDYGPVRKSPGKESQLPPHCLGDTALKQTLPTAQGGVGAGEILPWEVQSPSSPGQAVRASASPGTQGSRKRRLVSVEEGGVWKLPVPSPGQAQRGSWVCIQFAVTWPGCPGLGVTTLGPGSHVPMRQLGVTSRTSRVRAGSVEALAPGISVLWDGGGQKGPLLRLPSCPSRPPAPLPGQWGKVGRD